MDLKLVQNRKLLDSYWAGATDGRQAPALLLDAAGRIVAATDSMLALLQTRDTFSVRSNGLQATDAAEDGRLQKVIAGALSGPRRSGATRINQRSRLPLIVTAFPLPGASRTLGTANAFALVTVIDREGGDPPDVRLWVEAFGFTPREGDLAALLMAGHSLESAASVRGVTLHTTRVHMRGLLRKTHTSRQAELVRLLAKLPS